MLDHRKRGRSLGVGEGGGGLTDVALASNDMMDEAGAVLLHQVDETVRPLENIEERTGSLL